MAVPGAVFSGDVPLIEGFRSIVDPEEFLFAGESPYDIRIADLRHVLLPHQPAALFRFGRYIDPFAPMLVAIIGWNDRQMINACLLYRFAMSYEPRDFHGQLDEMPVSMSYGRAVDDLRRRYREWLWDAEFRDTLGAEVTAGGAPLDTYTVFRRKDGRRAVAFANMSDADPMVCEVSLDHARRADLKLVSPEQPEPRPWAGQTGTGSGIGRGCSGRLMGEVTTSLCWWIQA